MNTHIGYTWLFALALLTTSAIAQTTLYFRILAPTANSEILDLHKWGTLVWSNDNPGSTYTIQSSTTPLGPWTNFYNGWPIVGYSNIYSQVVTPDNIPSGMFSLSTIAISFNPALSTQEQAAILSSYGLTTFYNYGVRWEVQVTQPHAIEWCGILDCNPHVESVDLIGLIPW